MDNNAAYQIHPAAFAALAPDTNTYQSGSNVQTVPMFNFCPKCGVKREAAWKYCPNDGRSLSELPANGWTYSSGLGGSLSGQQAHLQQPILRNRVGDSV